MILMQDEIASHWGRELILNKPCDNINIEMVSDPQIRPPLCPILSKDVRVKGNHKSHGFLSLPDDKKPVNDQLIGPTLTMENGVQEYTTSTPKSSLPCLAQAQQIELAPGQTRDTVGWPISATYGRRNDFIL